MNTIHEYVECKVREATGRVMAGDQAIPVDRAIDIAVDAAEKAAKAAMHSTMSNQRFTMACQVAGTLAAASPEASKKSLQEVAAYALLIVDYLYVRTTTTEVGES